MRVSREAASRSAMIMASLWTCRNEAGTRSVMLPSMVSYKAWAESSSHATQMILAADRMLPMPSVTAVLGTRSLCKSSDTLLRESLPSSIRRQALLRAEPGSL